MSEVLQDHSQLVRGDLPVAHEAPAVFARVREIPLTALRSFFSQGTPEVEDGGRGASVWF